MINRTNKDKHPVVMLRVNEVSKQVAAKIIATTYINGWMDGWMDR